VQTNAAQTFLFVACDRGDIASHTIDAATGALGDAVISDAGGVAVNVSVHPNGEFVVTSHYDGTAAVHQVAQDSGAFTRLPAFDVPDAANTHGSTFSGDGEFLYIANAGSNSVAQYRFDVTLGLPIASLDPPSVAIPNGGEPRHLAHSRDGKRVYLMSQLPAKVVTFNVTADGTLSALGPGEPTTSVVYADGRGKDLVLDAAEEFLYGSSWAEQPEENRVSVFSIADDGALTLLQDLPSGDTGLQSIAIDPAGEYLFAIHDGPGVATWGIGPDGLLMSKGALFVALGQGIAVVRL
jgi:6-phosphogluconolactonase